MSRGRCLSGFRRRSDPLFGTSPTAPTARAGITAPWVPMVNWPVAARTFVRTDRLLRLASMLTTNSWRGGTVAGGELPFATGPPRVRRLVDHDLWNLLTVEVGDTGLIEHGS